MSIEHVSRARACLMGQCVGDVLGSMYVGLTKKNIVGTMDENYCSKTRLLLMKGNCGYWTKSSVALASSIVECSGYDNEHARKTYIEWVNSTEELGVDHSVPNESFLSVHSLYRMIPISIVGTTVPEVTLLQWSHAHCTLSHTNIISIDACKVLANSLRAAIITGDKNKVMATAFATAHTQTIKDLLKNSLDYSNTFFYREGPTSRKIRADEAPTNYVGIALQCAFYEVTHSTHFEKSMERTIAKGGNVEFNCSIVGSIMGALHGINSIPNEWKRVIVDQYDKKILPNVLNVADKLLYCKGQ